MSDLRPPLTRLVHERLQAHLAAGDLAIDATAGNGHDTLFLARQVGPSGAVQAFDIQRQAIEKTRERLQAAAQHAQVTLHQVGHEHMAERVPSDWQGRVAAITFNLGYLPGGHHATTTLPATTLAALDQALALLCPGGVLSVLVYRGHPGGQAEADAVEAWFRQQAAGLHTETSTSPGPVLYFGSKSERKNGEPSPG